ncbi:MAG: sarcosine oxidase subunit gamma [Halieaceae bacterium]|jgi:sarcosine oxidase subunit gamma
MIPRERGKMSEVCVETPLHYFLDSTGAQQNTESEFAIAICEIAAKGHLNLRGNSQDESFRAGVRNNIGLELPTEPGTWCGDEQSSIYWLGPDEWLVIVIEGRQAVIEANLRQAISGHISVADISSGQTLLNLSGAGVATLLKKSCGYDFDAQKFGVGRCVQTSFAKATALAARREDGSFDLVIRRSFADYLARWMLDAGAEFGCTIYRHTG